ncbi:MULTISPECIES: hypothetical protein [Paenarthrobacter]|uniref:Uncharacterized protein n=1 Tax=Paenarthrobacter ureafaciens TaxID=37931 RepID=A0AAX3EQG4_PAEUR|nr:MULTISPECIES: hypothetical protein [Paenarthrobacter]MDO5878138.1 hypothetical protein [Paenarthrobacter sp. SD-1]NHW49293.1 hypothetical protein [Paenarthrobacter sp. MSM-2-10-13]UYW00007.1 hypothetical protein NL394_22950 [Paenarthrobacter ureafaciens]
MFLNVGSYLLRRFDVGAPFLLGKCLTPFRQSGIELTHAGREAFPACIMTLPKQPPAQEAFCLIVRRRAREPAVLLDPGNEVLCRALPAFTGVISPGGPLRISLIQDSGGIFGEVSSGFESA